MSEPIEAWRAEFLSNFDDETVSRHRESMWQGFLMAKRSQPVVVLPRPIESLVFQSLFNADDICAALNKAGIAYTVEVSGD